jgi:two-component system, NarL family, sensor histidine kinase DegS
MMLENQVNKKATSYLVNNKISYILLPFILLFNITFGQENTSIKHQIDSLLQIEDYKGIINYKHTFLNYYKGANKAKYQLILGESFENLNIEDSAFIYYQKALKGFKTYNLPEAETKTNQIIYSLLESQNNLDSNKDYYLNEILKYAKKTKSKKWLASYYTNYGVNQLKYNVADSAKYFFNKAMKLAQEIDSTSMQINLLISLGSLYSRKYKNNDSAIYYYNNALKLYYSDTLNIKDFNTEFNLFNNIGNAYRRKKNFKTALEYYNKAEPMKLLKLNRKSKKILYSNMEATYYYMNDFNGAYDYLYKYDSIKDIINLKDQNASIVNIEEKYENEKLRGDNLESEAKRKKNRNYLIAALLTLFFGSITFFLIQKNTKRKQLLAEQDKALETQKLATVLKEQELTSIDAMIEGQEKERQRIANDLHDDLGGLMATVKMHFNALQDKQTPELYDKTNTLLDEAYNKIRTVAHAKNSGVIAKQGLLKTVQTMANKISIDNKIEIDVIDHGLENRLENSLELTIFRIIQELITNVIKHANASQTTIHLTNHEDTLNIMVEDNGKGFNPNQITKTTKGMGISSIDKRVEHLNGTMTIESEINQGTSIIIDIPL